MDVISYHFEFNNCKRGHMIRKILGSLLLILFCWPLSSHAQSAAILNGLNWLKVIQATDGRWGASHSSSTDYYTTVSVLESFAALGDSSLAYTNGLTWLKNANAESTTYLAPRIKTVVASGGDATTDITNLLSYQNSDSGWGGYLNQASSNFHTASAL